MEHKSILEELYMSPEMEEIFERGRKLGIKQHICPKVRTKMVFTVRKEHINSRKRGWGVVSNKQLLNKTFNTEEEATRFIFEGLMPVNPKYRSLIDEKTFAVKLAKGSHY